MCFSAYSVLCGVVIWTTRKKELYDDESFSSQTLVACYKDQIKVKSGLRDRGSLRLSWAKGGRLLRACVAW